MSEPVQRVLVTGATGLVGSHVAAALLAQGCRVAALVRPGSSRARLANHPALEWIAVDLLEIEPAAEAIKDFRPDACIHCGWYVVPGKYLTAPENIEHVFASLRLLRLLIEAGCGQVVMVGSCAEYALSDQPLGEDAPIEPATLYAAAKHSLSILARQVARDAGIHLVWARVFFLYGGSEDPRRVVPALIQALLRGEEFPASGGEQRRDYLHVDDVAGALCFLAQQRLDGIYNVCSGEPVSLRDLMQTTGELLGRAGLIRFGALPPRAWEPPLIAGDPAKIRAAGWQPRYDLRSGLAAAVDYWRAQEQAA